jgi:hypothetical protein
VERVASPEVQLPPLAFVPGRTRTKLISTGRVHDNRFVLRITQQSLRITMRNIVLLSLFAVASVLGHGNHVHDHSGEKLKPLQIGAAAFQRGTAGCQGTSGTTSSM